MTDKEMMKLLAYLATSKYYPALKQWFEQKQIEQAMALAAIDLSKDSLRGAKIQGSIELLKTILIQLEAEGEKIDKGEEE